MPWLRVGDTAASHPVVLRALELPQADERLKMELFGFAALAASMSASHKSDYIVELGTIRAIAGFARAEELIKAAIACGYFEEISKGGNTAYKLLDDPELFHMRLKEEIDWENRRKNDNRNKSIIVPVRLRDGDACRWCGKVVYWGDQKSARGGTYDHLHPSKGAEKPSDMVVACRSCNSSRKDNKDWNGTLLAVPKKPYYGRKTVDFLAENDITVSLSPESEKPVITGQEALSRMRETANSVSGTPGSVGDGLECVPPLEASSVRGSASVASQDCARGSADLASAPEILTSVSLNGDAGFSAQDAESQISAFMSDLDSGDLGDGLEAEESKEGDQRHAWHPVNWDNESCSVSGTPGSVGDGLECVPPLEASSVRGSASVASQDCARGSAEPGSLFDDAGKHKSRSRGKRRRRPRLPRGRGESKQKVNSEHHSESFRISPNMEGVCSGYAGTGRDGKRPKPATGVGAYDSEKIEKKRKRRRR